MSNYKFSCYKNSVKFFNSDQLIVFLKIAENYLI